MVFRKPYAFLIKNFKKIHIALLILCAFTYYKTMQLDQFVKEFISYLSYDAYVEPITKYTSPLFYLSTLLIVIITGSLAVLLKRKEKPWKLYLIPMLEYLGMILIAFLIQRFFNAYEGENSTTTIRAYSNFLWIFRMIQYPIFIILIMRITGLDLKKFDFSKDEEFLELEQDDREEFEINIDVDKHAFYRTIKKTQRILGYFYEEHKFIMNIVFSILAVFFLGSTYYYFGVSHKVVKESQILKANNYLIRINESYYTNKDLAGNKLERNSDFVILNLTVKNNGSTRKFNTESFHLVNGNHEYSYAGNTYANYFKDLGNPYPTRKLKNGEQVTFSLVFKVSNELKSDKFVLYYQQVKNRKIAYLRKIKLSLEDVTNIVGNGEKKLGQKLKIQYVNKEPEEFTFQSLEFKDQITYNIESCNQDYDCTIIQNTENAKTDKKILEIPFTSSSYEGQELIDFSVNYGRIIYKDSEGITKELSIENALKNKEYLGKYLYIEVPKDLETSESISFIYIVRNQKYQYKIR